LRAILLPPEELARKATAAPVAEVIGGAVILKSAGRPEASQATVQVTNAKPGSVLPWHVHRGTCDKDEGHDGDYRADVDKSSKDQHAFAACGELQPEE
jgi:hypothetical protein